MVDRRARNSVLILLGLLTSFPAGEVLAQRKKNQKKQTNVSLAEKESDYYRIVSFPYKDDFPLEVGAMLSRSSAVLLGGL